MIPNLLILLNNTKLQQKDIALYNVIKALIDNIGELDTVKISRDQIVTEGGQFTVLDGSGAALAITTNVTSWIKIDKLVVVAMNVTYPATASGASASIGGLPFICENLLTTPHCVAIGYQTANLNLQATVVTGTQKIQFTLSTGAAATNANLTTANIALTAIYKTP